jgi:hypothetical protein
LWACGAAGSALPWHGRGHRFDPGQVHQSNQQLTRDASGDPNVALGLVLENQRRPCSPGSIERGHQQVGGGTRKALVVDVRVQLNQLNHRAKCRLQGAAIGVERLRRIERPPSLSIAETPCSGISTAISGRFAHRGAIVRVPGGLLSAETDPESLIDAIFAPVYFRLLLRFAPLTEAYGNQLIDQAFLRVRPRKRASMIA